ncbi:hypothetical protein Tco_0890588 [Tanacetum coccineum]|uniref:Uncharacterized protein n=1 Tax=Tanacetum coccineum TaxID=301880 RepID=A0ABQ5C0V9_9ASTR
MGYHLDTILAYDYDDDDYTIIYSKPKAITPDLLIEEPNNSLIMGDEHLDTIPSVENLVPIPSESEGISDDTCDVPVYDDSSTFDALSNHSEILSDSKNDDTSSDDDSYENIEYVEASPLNLEYVSLEKVNEDQEEKEFDLEDIFQIQDGGLTSVVISDNSNNPLLELLEFESFHFDLYNDLSFPRPPPEPPDVEISLIVKTDAPVINNVDELNEDECFDPGGGEIDVEDDDSFTFVIRTFLPFLTYPETYQLESQLPPPPPPPSTNQSDQSKTTAAPSSSKTAASAEYTAWTTIDTRLKPSVSSIPEDLHMDDDSTPDEQVHSSDDEDIGNDHIPKVNLKQDWWKPLSEEDRPATPEPMNNWASALASTYAPPPENSLLAQTGDMAMFMDWYCKKQGITELKQKDLEGPAFEIVKVFHPNVIHLQFQMEECHKLLTDRVDDAIIRYNVSKPLPLGGQPGQVTIQTDFFFNKDLEYLRYGSKGGRPALSISKMKAAYYPDVGLEQMVPDQMWIEEECKYDIAAMYGISHWWFQRQRFYIDRHTSEGDRKAVRTHMRILSVVRIEVFSLYGYDYMKKIVLRRADLKEHIIAERDFKYLYPKIFNLWIRNLVIRQQVEDFQLGIESYQTQLNITKPRWDATGFEFKHDFTVIDSPRAVTFRDKYGVQRSCGSEIPSSQ